MASCFPPCPPNLREKGLQNDANNASTRSTKGAVRTHREEAHTAQHHVLKGGGNKWQASHQRP